MGYDDAPKHGVVCSDSCTAAIYQGCAREVVNHYPLFIFGNSSPVVNAKIGFEGEGEK